MPLHKTFLRPQIVLSMALTVLTVTACSGTSQEDLLAKARQEMASGNNRAATVDLRSLVKQHPENAQGRLLLGSLLFKLGDPGAAAAQLQQASKLKPIPVDASFNLVQSLIQIGHLNEAHKVLSALNTTNPREKSELLAFEGEIALGKKDTENASKLFASSLADNPHSARALVGQAMVALLASRPGLALKKVEMAIEVSPDNGTAWMVKGFAEFAQHKVENAAADLGKALRYGPPSLSPSQVFITRGRLAQAELALGQRDEALINVKAMLAQSPKHPYPNFLRGLIAFQNKHYANAAQHLQTSLNSDPYNVQALTLLAQAEAEQGQDVLAMNHLSGALAQDPQNPQARQLMASLQLKSGENERAIQTMLNHGAGAANPGEILSLFASPDAAIKALSAMQAQHSGGKHRDIVKLALAQALIMGSKQQQALAVLSGIQGHGDTKLDQLKLKAAAYIQAQEPAKAAELARQISSEDRQNIKAMGLAAAIYMATNHETQAELVLKNAHALKPDDAQVTTLLAALALKQGNLNEADRYYHSALKHDPNNLDAMMSLARISAIRGNSSAALSWLQQASADHPKAPEPLVALAQYHLAVKQPAAALDDIQQAVALAPGNPAVLTLLAKTQLANGAQNAALQTFHNVVKLDPNNPVYGMNLAAMQTVLKQTKAAQTTLESVTAKHSDYYPAFRALALTQWRNGEQQAAFATAAKIAHGTQGQLQSEILTGDLNLMKKDYASALQNYRLAFAKIPSRDVVLRIYAAESEAHMGTASKTLTNWLSAHPDDAGLRNVLALYYLNHGNLRDSEHQYRLVLKQTPDNPAVLNNLAWLVSQHDPKQALPYAKKAYELLPRIPQVSDTLGWILVQLKEPGKALPILKSAAQSAPGNASIQYHYAVALADNHENSEAAALLSQTLSKTTAFPERNAAEALYRKLKS